MRLRRHRGRRRAGLSAALILGRCRRRVLVCDTGRPRNAASHGLHGYLTRDGIAPMEFLRLGAEELRRYDTVELREIEVVAARAERGGFAVDLAGGAVLGCRKLLVATGVVDDVPGLFVVGDASRMAQMVVVAAAEGAQAALAMNRSLTEEDLRRAVS